MDVSPDHSLLGNLFLRIKPGKTRFLHNLRQRFLHPCSKSQYSMFISVYLRLKTSNCLNRVTYKVMRPQSHLQDEFKGTEALIWIGTPFTKWHV